MRPTFSISADGINVTGGIKDRLLELRIVDKAGTQSDTVDITLDDRDGAIALPRRGAELSVAIGYEETGLVDKGLFVVDEIEGSDSPATLVIKAKAADMRGALKAPKTRGWDGKTLGEIVKTIAGENGLEPKVSPDLAGMPFEHVDQTNESDMHFLTRLARQFDAVAKPANGFLVVVPKGQSKSATGKALAAISLSRGDITTFRFTVADRGKYGKVVAFYRDEGAAKDVAVEYGDGEPVYTIRTHFPNRDQAYAGAKAKKESLDRGTGTISITMPGRPEAMAEAPLTTAGLRDGANGAWVAETVTHVWSGSGGCTTEIEAERPK